MQLFQVQVSTNRTEYIITNDTPHPTTDDTRNECAIRWKIEQLHCEAKQHNFLKTHSIKPDWLPHDGKSLPQFLFYSQAPLGLYQSPIF